MHPKEPQYFVKIFTNSGVITFQISMTIYFGFRYVNQCSHWSGSDVMPTDSVPAHRTREAVHLLTRETPDFIAPTPWPAISPDLNPVDYRIWGKLQERVYRSPIHDVAQLKSRQIKECEHFNHDDWWSIRDVEDILNSDFCSLTTDSHMSKRC